ncbi:MAG: phosphatidate cytidylyltransferase [Candidatus Dormiibacterota bacterium]
MASPDAAAGARVPVPRSPSAMLLRIAVAAVLLVMLLSALVAGIVWLSILIGALVMVGTAEYYLITRRMGHAAAPWVLFPLTLVLLFRFHIDGVAPWALPAALSLAVVVGLGGFLFLRQPGNSMVRWALALAGALYLGWTLGFYFALYTAHDPDPGRIGFAWVVALAGSTMIGDTVALLVGSRLGRHRFFPSISPNKSVEGAVGGFIAATIAFATLSTLADLPFVHGLILGALVAVAAQAGDLIESQFKRSAGVKDASNLLPGHGGLLDRIDSLVLIPGVAYYYLILVVHLRLPQ